MLTVLLLAIVLNLMLLNWKVFNIEEDLKEEKCKKSK